MRFLACLRKSLMELRREPLMLLLSLSFAPAFVVLYWAVFPALQPRITLAVIDRDVPVVTATGARIAVGEAMVAVLRAGQGSARGVALETPADRGEAEQLLRRRRADALLLLPPALSRAVVSARLVDPVPAVMLTGDFSNPTYPAAAAVAMTALDEQVRLASARTPPYQVAEEPLGGSGSRTDFELYVPGLLVFSIVMLVFLAAMMVTREFEAGTLQRLRLSRATSVDVLGGQSAALLLLGVVSVALTGGTALALGFRSQGSLWLAGLVAVATVPSVVGAGLVVACFARNGAQAFVIANFPLALFMFFTGVMLPMPPVILGRVLGHPIALFDILPPTHAVRALNAVLNLGTGLGEVVFEVAALGVLSGLYFAAGAWLFQRRRMALA